MNARPIPHSWLDPRVQVRPSPISGRGLFARAPIAAGEIVERWGGIRITDAELARIAATLPRYNSAAIGEGINLLLALDDPIGFGNHSCDPNLWMHDATTVVARRAIARDEELTIDYATHTVTPSWQMEVECRCGSPLCRHIITGNDWQRPELQERYRGHFSPFINDRIAQFHEART
jgi:uncharacterized protein